MTKQRPTTKKYYTQQDLKEYALYRKTREFETIKKVKDDLEDGKGNCDSWDEHEEYREPLAITEDTTFDIVLSTGGDADGFKITYSKDGDLKRGFYYWADWGVYEEVMLSDDEADEVAQYYNLDLMMLE